MKKKTMSKEAKMKISEAMKKVHADRKKKIWDDEQKEWADEQKVNQIVRKSSLMDILNEAIAEARHIVDVLEDLKNDTQSKK